MAGRLVARGLAALCLAVGGCATQDPELHFTEAPGAHVVAPGEALDPSAAYVVIVPHVENRSGSGGSIYFDVHVSVSDRPELLAWLTSSPPFGQRPVNLAVAVSTNRATVVRVPPGRYFVSKVFVQSVYYEIDADYSLFDARAGQLNYPGDWTVETGFHEITRGARRLGWYFNATLAEGGVSDLGTLVADTDGPVARLPRAYTRQASTRTAPGDR